jgi:histidine ammonia-lyase
VNIELASMDDNPLVDIASGRMISNGNFHPLAMALAADALRPALAHVGQLSDRRLNHLWAVVATDIDVTAVDPAAASELAGLLMRYSSAVRYAELRELAGPVTLDIAPLDLGVEDHATNAVTAVQRSAAALGLLDDLLTVELLVSTAILRHATGGSSTLGAGVEAVLGAVTSIVDELGANPASDEIHAALKGSLYDRVLPAAKAAA